MKLEEQAQRVIADRYELHEELGRGGMAVVYRATDRRIHRTVAVKVLYPYLALKGAAQARFQREAQVVGRLRHPNIVEIYDYSGIDSEEHFIVSEYVDGQTLKAFLLEHERMPSEIALMVVAQVAQALQHAHNRGVVHRDVKPENIMIGPGGKVKLMDFGIAQMRDMDHMTVTGTMIGSPCHMSPEHIEGRDLDARADIFSLGTVLYALCVGQLPFVGTNPHALLKAILDVRYVPAIQVMPSIGDETSRIVDRCMRREPELRYSDCRELEADIRLHLAAMFLDSDPTLLQRYFKNPSDVGREVEQQLVVQLIARGRQRVRSKEMGAALRDFDRALSFDSEQTDIISELDRIQRRMEFQRVLLRVGLPAAGVVLLLGIALLGFLRMGWWPLGDSVATTAHIEGAQPTNDAPGPAGRAGLDPLPALARSKDASPVTSQPAPLAETRAPGSDSQHSEVDRRKTAGTAPSVPPLVPEALPSASTGATAPGSPGCGLVLDPMQSDACEPDLRRELLAVSTQGPELPLRRIRRWPTLGPTLPRRDTIAERTRLDPRRVRTLPKEPIEVPVESRPPGDAREDGRAPPSGGISSEERVVLPVTIEADPPAVEIFVDGKQVGQGKIQGLPLVEGSHRLRLHHPSCDNCVDRVVSFQLSRDVPPPLLRERIGFKDATLIVRSEGKGMVFVGDKLLGKTGESLALQPESPRPWTEKIRVLYDDRTSAPWEGAAQLESGKTTVVQP